MATPLDDALDTLFGLNLVRDRKHNETSGVAAVDDTGNADATYTNGPVLNQGALTGDDDANSVLLDGIEDSILQDSEGLFNGTSTVPVCLIAIIKTPTPQTNKVIAHWGRANSSRRSFVLGIDGSGNIAMATENSSNTPNVETISSAIAVNDGEMHLVVGVWNRTSDRRLYVDGVLVASTTDAYTYGTSGTNFNFDIADVRSDGILPGALGPFAGQVGRCCYAKQSITTEQVEALWAASQPSDPEPEAPAVNCIGRSRSRMRSH